MVVVVVVVMVVVIDGGFGSICGGGCSVECWLCWWW